jgi:hypothetical protein
VADRISDLLHSERLTIQKVIEVAPIRNRAEVNRWVKLRAPAGGTPAHLQDPIGALVGILAHVASVHGKSSRGAGSLANLSILEPIFPLNFFVLIFSARE